MTYHAIALTISTGALVSTEVFEGVGYEEDFTIVWSFSIDGGLSWAPVGTTATPMYFAWKTPTNSQSEPNEYFTAMVEIPRFRTLVHLGAVNVPPNATSDLDVAIAIYSAFQTKEPDDTTDAEMLTVRRFDGTQLRYWAPGTDEATNKGTVRALIETTSDNCGAWSELLIGAWEAQGIAGAVARYVSPLDSNELMMVNGWTFSGNGNEGDAYAYTVGVDAVHTASKAQGNNSAPKLFKDHWIVEYAGKWFDPSYGSQVFDSHIDWEDSSILGFVKKGVDGSATNAARKKLDGIAGTGT